MGICSGAEECSLGSRVAVVTGASSPIGAAVAVGLAQHRLSLCLVGRDRELLEAAVREARKAAPFVLPYPAELTHGHDVQVLADVISQTFDGIDLLVHCAGANIAGGIESTPIEDFDTLYQTNILAPYHLTRTLLPAIKSRQGLIIFVNSSCCEPSHERWHLFQSSQHALRGIANELREEVRLDGVRVLTICAGCIATPKLKALLELEGKPYNAGLLLQPEDIAQVVLYSLSVPRRAELTYVEMRPSVNFNWSKLKSAK